jgi:Ca-activated chloride channel family protein
MNAVRTILSGLLVFLMLGQVQAGILVKGEVIDVDQNAIAFAKVSVERNHIGTITDQLGRYEIEVESKDSRLIFEAVGYKTQIIRVGNRRTIDVSMVPEGPDLSDAEVVYDIMNIDSREAHPEEVRDKSEILRSERKFISGNTVYQQEGILPMVATESQQNFHTEGYDLIQENGFKSPGVEPLSTFSIDVDGASYSNVRRMINQGQIPHKDAVRIEEMVNYFSYNYPDPTSEHPFSITTEVSTAPWNVHHRLVHIGLQGKKVDLEDLQPTNLVFLIDVSGSMNAPNKLQLLKSSLKLLVDELGERDKVAIVVYAGAAGLVLPSTSANNKQAIKSALDQLQAGGSTAGGAGIELAYKVASENLIEGGNNRVVLATDGDFNVGASSNAEMVRLIEEKRKQGIFLTITGFGMGNYKDGKMEQISNAGNGNYYYIDNIKEAKKVFVTEMRGTLFTIAKDVKLQVEFNPQVVQAYRLIGYENRLLNPEDFNDDKKDAGELGAGHTVTALYEIIPVGVNSTFIKDVDALKYQTQLPRPTTSEKARELLTVKFRYKDPDGHKSKLIVQSLNDESIAIQNTSENFRFSASVAQFGMILRESEFLDDKSVDAILNLANSSIGKDEEGYRREFLAMVESYQLMRK